MEKQLKAYLSMSHRENVYAIISSDCSRYIKIIACFPKHEKIIHLGLIACFIHLKKTMSTEVSDVTCNVSDVTFADFGSYVV